MRDQVCSQSCGCIPPVDHHLPHDHMHVQPFHTTVGHVCWRLFPCARAQPSRNFKNYRPTHTHTHPQSPSLQSRTRVRVACTGTLHLLREPVRGDAGSAAPVIHRLADFVVVVLPGSGKTSVIVNRILFLRRTVGVQPKRILAVSFTNKSSAELKDRLRPHADLSHVPVVTFHKLCLQLLQR